MSSKKPATRPQYNGALKCRHLLFSTAQNVELLSKLEKGTPVIKLKDEYGVGTTTMYDLKKQREDIKILCRQ